MRTRRAIPSPAAVALTPESATLALRHSAELLESRVTLAGIRRVMRAMFALYGAPPDENARAVEADLTLLRPRLAPLPDALPDPSWLARAHELLLGDVGQEGARARKRSGAYYTPDAIVERLLDLTLESRADEALSGARGADAARALLALRVCDPSCGSGRFLIAAGLRLSRRLRALVGQPAPGPGAPDTALALIARTCLVGMDLAPSAVELCRFLLWHRCAGALPTPELLARSIRVGEALFDDWTPLLPEPTLRAPARGFDVIVGNPPFLNQLRTPTARARVDARRVHARFADAARPYADTSALFLTLALRLARADARIALIQPQSLLSARDAQGVRQLVERAATLTHLWLAGERVFDADVLVCAPVLRTHAPGSTPRVGPVARVLGERFEQIPARDLPRGATWAPLIADALGVPEVDLPASGRTIADLAHATADFRDQYYGLRGMLVEDADLTEGERPRFPALVTTGLVDLAHSRWGERATRFDHAPWSAPRVDLERLERETDLGPWARSRLVPKLLLATQTSVLEVLADPTGEMLPAVPLITITPRDPDDLWRLGALLACPALAAECLRLYAGAALSLDVIKVSAKQVLRLPVPDPTIPGVLDHWDRAARAFQWASTATSEGVRRQLLVACAHESLAAYGLERAVTRSLMRWWIARF